MNGGNLSPLTEAFGGLLGCETVVDCLVGTNITSIALVSCSRYASTLDGSHCICSFATARAGLSCFEATASTLVVGVPPLVIGIPVNLCAITLGLWVTRNYIARRVSNGEDSISPAFLCAALFLLCTVLSVLDILMTSIMAFADTVAAVALATQLHLMLFKPLIHFSRMSAILLWGISWENAMSPYSLRDIPVHWIRWKTLLPPAVLFAILLLIIVRQASVGQGTWLELFLLLLQVLYILFFLLMGAKLVSRMTNHAGKAKDGLEKAKANRNAMYSHFKRNKKNLINLLQLLRTTKGTLKRVFILGALAICFSAANLVLRGTIRLRLNSQTPWLWVCMTEVLSVACWSGMDLACLDFYAKMEVSRNQISIEKRKLKERAKRTGKKTEFRSAPTIAKAPQPNKLNTELPNDYDGQPAQTLQFA